MKGRKIIGHRIERFNEVGSTNDTAKKLARDGAQEGTVVITRVQKKGRGRIGRSWSSLHGGLWLSVILRPDVESERISLLPLIAGNCVANTLNGLYGIDAHVRWPNDVLISKKKVSGVLSELDYDEKFVVIGIGINANINVEDLPEEIREIATTLKEELKREVPLEELSDHLFSELDSMYALFNSGTVEIKCNTTGKQVKIITKEEEFTGTAKEIDKTGALILQLSDGTMKRIISGDCIHLSTENPS